jgi:uncharacterized membrane protein YdjX (TVP38/TMEM64 family)
MRVKKLKLVLPVFMATGLVAPVVFVPFLPGLAHLLDHAASWGLWGPLALGGIHAASCVLLIPGSMPTLAAGFFFGLLVGSLTSILGSTVGACLAFLIGRSMARHWIAARIARSPRFTAIDHAIGAHGFRVVLLSRLSPLSPFIFLNYILGLTKVSFWDYAWGTLLGMTPGTVLFVYFGVGLRSLAEVVAYARGQGPVPAGSHLLLWLSLAATVVITILLAWMARDALRKAVPSSAADKQVIPAE